MSQTTEDRIRAEYKAHRRHSHVYEWGVSSLWMSLAQQWQLPVREIKRIVKGECGAVPDADGLRSCQILGVEDPHCVRYKGHADPEHSTADIDVYPHFIWNVPPTPFVCCCGVEDCDGIGALP